MTDLSQQDLSSVLASAGWPPDQINNAIGVIEGESKGNPSVIGWDNNGATVADTNGALPTTTTGQPIAWSSYDTGLFQINSSSNSSAPANQYDPQWITAMQDPTTNAAQALAMYHQRGWEPWSGDSYINANPQLLSSPNAQGNNAGSAPNSPTGGVRSGFLFNLQSILNPSLGKANPVASFVLGGVLANEVQGIGSLADPNNWEAIAIAILARGGIAVVGAGITLFGVAITLINVANSDTTNNIVGNAGRIQRLAATPKRLALAQQAEERRAQTLADKPIAREHELKISGEVDKRQSIGVEERATKRKHEENLQQRTHEHRNSYQSKEHAQRNADRRMAYRRVTVAEQNADTKAAHEARLAKSKSKKRS